DYLDCPPHDAAWAWHSSWLIASGDNQIVRLPRSTRDLS
ncbi:MAG: hypothetical protein ACI89X_003731, partial [Planctomycetota bacterium]